MDKIILTKFDKKILDEIGTKNIIALDTETVSLKDKTLVGFSISYIFGTISTDEPACDKFYIPVRHTGMENMPIKDAKKLLNGIKALGDVSNIIFHNSSFDIPVFLQFGIDFKDCNVDDTYILARLFDDTLMQNQYGLKALVRRYFNYTMKTYKELCGTGKKQISFADINEKAAAYGADDAYWTLRLYCKFIHELDEDSKQVYLKIEKPLLKVVADMHYNGITIDIGQVKAIQKVCEEKIAETKDWLNYTLGDINLNSAQQLTDYFINKQGLPVLEYTKKGKPSMSKEVLKKYAQDNKSAAMILTYRKYSKFLSTFVPALTPEIGDKIYANFNQAGTASGRFSSSGPNMQNIPRETIRCPDCGNDKIQRIKPCIYCCDKCDKVHKLLDIRHAIVARPGYVLIGADYSQIELRITAHCSLDANMMSAYRNNKDIHQMTADACGCSRQQAKTINFGLIYGMWYKKLAEQLKIPIDEAAKYWESYWQQYPGVQKFIDDAAGMAIINGYTQTIFGRRRRLDSDFNDKDDYQKRENLRSLVNAIIQGTGADLIKMAMADMYDPLKKIRGRLVLTEHDEILAEVPKDQLDTGKKIVSEAMLRHQDEFRVPILIDMKTGDNWGEAHG